MTVSLVEAALRRDRAIVVTGMVLLFLLAGLYTLFGVGMDMTALDMTRMAGMADMPGARAAGAWSAGFALLVFLMWWVMMVAMMLPSVTPTVLLYAGLLRRTRSSAQVPGIALAFVAGYLVAWAAFSVAATGLQWGLESAGLVSPTMMTLIDTWPGALVLIAAGGFQFSRLKDTCLTRCRTPADFIARRRRPGAWGGFAMGTEHGVYCLGCCWALMALLFVGGIMNLYWIVGLAAFVALEKLTPWGRVASRVAGAGLIGWGAAVLAGTV